MNKRNWCLVAAVALVAVAPTVARADESTTTMSTTTTTTTYTPIVVPTITPAPLGPTGQPIDFTVLSNRSFDYVNLAQAHAQGFSDEEIATIAKIADKTNMPFNDIAQMALNGVAFPTIAQEYNLRLADVLDASDYVTKISDYRVAYENTGTDSVRNLVAGSRQEYSNATVYGSTNATQNLTDLINNSSDLTMFARAIRTAGLTSLLSGSGQYTVFAPTDSAFAKLSSDQVNTLFSDQSQLLRVLNFHIIPQRIDSAAAFAMTSPTSPNTLAGIPLNVTSSGGTLMINGATVTSPNWFATNGIVHKIDTVLMPPVSSTTTTTTTVTTTPAP